MAERDDAAVRDLATSPDESFIVQAPAGSGKTSLLVLRFLRLLATVERPEEILAITFTRKAAAEMRHRIVAALAAAAGPPLPATAGDHERRQRELAEAALARSAERGWDLAAHPARLHIQTIDGLNHWLARHLPLAARLGLQMSLQDDPQALYDEAARRFVARLEDGGAEAAGIERLARLVQHDPGALAGLLSRMLAGRELWLPRLLGDAADQDLRTATDALLLGVVRAELAAVRSGLDSGQAVEVLAVIREAAAAGPDDGPLRPLAGLRQLPPPTEDALPQWLALAELLLTAEGQPRRSFTARQGFLPKSEGPPWAELKARMQQASAALAAEPGFAALQRLRELPPTALSDLQWERIDALRLLLPAAAAELQLLFAERAQLDHAAVAAAAREALGSPDAPTELALALDYRIRHLLVDEYQDTSPAQVMLLEQLLAGWMPGDGRTLFCVGDPMQSIYAFREADVTLFLEAQQRGVGPVPLKPLRLERNFRSRAPLVSWFNDSFATLLPPQDDFERGAVRYTAARHEREDAPGAGVQVHPLIDADEQQAAAHVAELARALVAGGAGRPGSVAILVRGRNALPPILAALRAAGVDYRGVDLESLADRGAVRDLVALAKALLHPGDRSAWLAVLRAPWCGLRLADLHALAAPDRDAAVPALLADETALVGLSPDGRARALGLRRTLDTARRERGERSLGGWLKAAWLGLGGPATLEDPSDLVNAEWTFDALDALEREAGPWPEGTAIEASVAKLRASPFGRADAQVQLMTIHRAKGLEFDAVILPELQRSPRAAERPLLYWTSVASGPGQRGLVLASRGESAARDAAPDPLEAWMRRLHREREYLELGRVAYVAATRAREQLHLVGRVTVAWKDDEPSLRKPLRGSLLEFWWPVLRDAFEQALAAAPSSEPAGSADRRPRRQAGPLRRLPRGAVLPAAPEPLRLSRLRIVGGHERLRPDFDWAGAIALAAGQVVHRELHRLARAGLPASALAPRPEAWARELSALGIGAEHLVAATARVTDALARVAESDTAAQLLDPGQAEAQSELALTMLLDGEVHGLRIDRTFVDAQGRRWIVDWKTSAHEGGDLAGFLDSELDRYAPQLARYAEALRRQDGRPQVIGLYFPLLDAWREWRAG